MRIALKYGLMITAGIVLWVIATHFVLHVGPESRVNTLTPLLFNLFAIAAIFLGIKSRKDEMGGDFGLRDGMKIGLSIAVVYAISSCLFFMVLLLLVGPKLMANEQAAQSLPTSQLALLAFAGLFFGAIIFGAIYSLVISFFLTRIRQG